MAFSPYSLHPHLSSHFTAVPALSGPHIGTRPESSSDRQDQLPSVFSIHRAPRHLREAHPLGPAPSSRTRSLLPNRRYRARSYRARRNDLSSRRASDRRNKRSALRREPTDPQMGGPAEQPRNETGRTDESGPPLKSSGF